MFQDDESRTIPEAEGEEDSFSYLRSGNTFRIGFDKIFDRPNLSIYNEFDMTSKRNFKNLAPAILKTYNELFLTEDGKVDEEIALVLFNMLKVKADLMTEQTSYSSFIEKIDLICESGKDETGKGMLLKRIDEFVEGNYTLDLDVITEETRAKNKKVNTELQFKDSHARELLKISFLYRVMIPIISEYLMYNKDQFAKPSMGEAVSKTDEDMEEMEFDEINSQIFSYLFEKFSKNPGALRNKLYKLVYSRISKTSYSDKKFWGIAKNVGITKETETLEIYKKLLTNALPKLSLEGDRNVVVFFQSVVNNQIDFLFQNKFRYRLTTLGGDIERKYSTDDEDDSLTEYERIENRTTREDEGSFVVRKYNNRRVLRDLQKEFDVGVEDLEVKDLMKVLQRNSIQEEIVGMLTFQFFKDTKAIKYLDFYQYCYLVIACKKFLEKHKFIYLPKILLAKCEKHKERSSISGKKVRPEILSSKKYTDLVTLKFGYSAEEIEKPFLAFVGTTYSSVFRDDNGNELFDSSVKVGKIAEELVDLAYLV